MQMQKTEPELIWGANNIAAVIRRSPPATFHLLKRGDIPARKVGRQWVAEKAKLLAFLMGEAA